MTPDSLSDKLAALGVRLGARDLKPPRVSREHAIERVVSGEFEATPFGDAFVVHAEYPSTTRHGGQALYQPEGSLGALAQWTGDPRLEDVPLDQIAFLDTETTGLARGAGTYAFLIGVGRFEAQRFRLSQFFLRDPSQETAQLSALAAYMARCGALVTFNGRGFDVPLMNVRYTINGELSPFESLPNLDLLPVARRLWRERLASRSLGSLEENILHVQRTSSDIPGWMIPSLYFDYQRTGDARPLKGVFYHNEVDILSMVALVNHVSSLIEAPNDRVHELDLVGLGRAYEYAGDIARATRAYDDALGRDLPPEVWQRTLKRLSFIHKRQGDLLAAERLWERAAGEGTYYAHVELAKLCEHRRHDFRAAQAWTQRALERLAEKRGDDPRQTRRRAELEHRLGRLRTKLARQSQSETTAETHTRETDTTV